MSKFPMPLYNVTEYNILIQYRMCQTSLEESVLRSRMAIGTTDGRCPSSNGRLRHDQQHLIIISFISLNGLINFVSSLARDGIDALLRKILLLWVSCSIIFYGVVTQTFSRVVSPQDLTV